jgi:predicted NBD/HSP70 family sugar kinase
MTKSAAKKARTTYSGLDVSLKETAICIVDNAGEIILERSVPTDPQVIAKRGKAYSGVAGEWSTKLRRSLPVATSQSFTVLS